MLRRHGLLLVAGILRNGQRTHHERAAPKRNPRLSSISNISKFEQCQRFKCNVSTIVKSELIPKRTECHRWAICHPVVIFICLDCANKQQTRFLHAEPGFTIDIPFIQAVKFALRQFECYCRSPFSLPKWYSARTPFLPFPRGASPVYSGQWWKRLLQKTLYSFPHPPAHYGSNDQMLTLLSPTSLYEYQYLGHWCNRGESWFGFGMSMELNRGSMWMSCICFTVCGRRRLWLCG